MISISHLNKSFAKNHILKDISARIEPGTITAIAGPNGSGKTTLMKCLLGLLRYESGEIAINGHDISRSSLYKKETGYVPQQSALPPNLSVEDMVSMLMELRSAAYSRYEELVSLLHLEGQTQKKSSSLSGGTKQKAGLLLGMLFHPSVLILDEPLSYLDPATSVVVKEELLRMKENGCTVLLSSHNMHEIEEIAGQLIYILEGRIHFSGSPVQLMEHHGTATLESALSHVLKNHYESNRQNLKIYRA
ncbi:MAG: ABC transporter ATP-binding protein [Ignavibacteriales bacterium]|nr:MAG: ABC transporter ATP-binding protein [Ignavibacteriales bacterium]